MIYQEVFFSLFEFGTTTEGEWRISVLDVQTADWNGALFYVGGEWSRWEIDLFWMRQYVISFLNWWHHG